MIKNKKRFSVGIIAALICGGCTILAAIISVSVNFFNPSIEKKEKTVEKQVLLDSQNEIISRQEFYKRDYGTLAFLPNVKTYLIAKNTDSFLILTPCKEYQFKTFGQSIWLQFNHYLADTNNKRRHLGIFVVTFGRTGAIMPLEVYRNKRWVRPGKNEVLDEFSEVRDCPWRDYVKLVNKWVTPGAKLFDSDLASKGYWHAIPQGGKESSWDYRKFWKWAVDKCQETSKDIVGLKADFENIKVSTRLIGFNPIPNPFSKSPVLFNIDSLDQKGTFAFVAVYALKDNGQDVREWYWIHRMD
ncbi:MAG: hypothetical protein WC437_05020 [Patescibacteria group bacterium]